MLCICHCTHAYLLPCKIAGYTCTCTHIHICTHAYVLTCDIVTMPVSTCSPAWPCRPTFLKETSRLPKPKAAPAGRFSQAGARFKGVAGPASAAVHAQADSQFCLPSYMTWTRKKPLWRNPHIRYRMICEQAKTYAARGPHTISMNNAGLG